MKFNKPKNKEQARQVAMEYQEWASEQNLSWGEVANYQDKLYTMARKFGLVREFKENGIL